ncbi:Bifunctional protein: zinc-containing alcohol dehydrogenase / quinone oxidoreductase (NADPH:quinone reductase) (EC / Similar to arginate lyase [Amycolatopsis camponoti]|uniref:Bifunctional protein: zinc-containing alcohol dehydrogenase / quinone oxidoreductase ( NADPH:quinone reductase) n=1 Tax=Amycolatopsis camponoti TaxID=2606593 RepID=A0A6I8LFD6_9PSEU|nr:NADP-dependent oxidoreductase [Amycolatopsis camponoti]VVJ15043.1 Bifunctional protein: zinc-containing alcohol dehydrogenase / quinone oxidoreductase (NADPH:quinone reductase) (EC / Similar to arginate lyase [Amycolatopsis camponoti]
MRIVTQETLGGPEVLRVTEAPRPEPGPTEVLVRVHAAGINPVDWKVRAGGGFLGEPPFTVGWDVAGVVEQAGFGATGVREGDEVLGMPWFPRPGNAYAEYVTAPSRHFVRKPAGLSFAEAAALPLAGLTAWQGLVDVGNVHKGQRVFVDAAAGGVGHLAVQIAKARGAHVIGTASAGKHDLLRELGVDEPIDYHDKTATTSDVDVYFGLVGEESDLRWLPAIKEGGLLIAVPSGVADRVEKAAAARKVRTERILVEPDRGGLTGLVELIETGQLKVRVEQTFPLEDAAKAHELGESGRVSGKLVLTV